jgi:hypothetical protein
MVSGIPGLSTARSGQGLGRVPYVGSVVMATGNQRGAAPHTLDTVSN